MAPDCSLWPEAFSDFCEYQQSVRASVTLPASIFLITIDSHLHACLRLHDYRIQDFDDHKLQVWLKLDLILTVIKFPVPVFAIQLSTVIYLVSPIPSTRRPLS